MTPIIMAETNPIRIGLAFEEIPIGAAYWREGHLHVKINKTDTWNLTTMSKGDPGKTRAIRKESRAAKDRFLVGIACIVCVPTP